MEQQAAATCSMNLIDSIIMEKVFSTVTNSSFRYFDIWDILDI